MTVSAAKLEVNRRNSQRSFGPLTEAEGEKTRIALSAISLLPNGEDGLKLLLDNLFPLTGCV
jgi:hypothetical protein